MAKQILVLSPHLDDAVLSCSEHMREWRQSGSTVTVRTVFSSFRSPCLSPDARQCITELGFTTAVQYERKRRKEDVTALNALGIRSRVYDGLTDGGFRCHEGNPTYGSFDNLFRGPIAPADLHLVADVSVRLRQSPVPDLAVVPLALGNHIDHRLVRMAAEAVYPASHIVYYADAPYLNKPSSWSLSRLGHFVTHRLSYRSMSAEKQRAIAAYDSQTPRLFINTPIRYPELLFFPKGIT